MASMVQKYSGKSPAMSPEKSNFAQTANLLSQYLKGRGNLGDISRKLEPISGQEVAPRTTLNLLPNMENNSENIIDSSRESKSMDLRKISGAILEPATPPQMTIFYAGKVTVFDDIPADKAKEIMAFANNASSKIIPPPQELTFLDLPIARRASLHRFFEKRRDRIIANAPYQINSRSRADASKPEEKNSWIDLEAQLSSRQLELKL